MDSFTSPLWDQADTNNTIIEDEIEYWKKYSTGIFPALSINNKQFRGQLEALGVFNALCAGFADVPNECVVGGDQGPGYVPQEDGIKMQVLVLLVVLLIILNILAVYCYRRHQKREVHGEM
jgi:hypothetical protein